MGRIRHMVPCDGGAGAVRGYRALRGGGMPWNAEVLTMPVWAFHGALDDVVPLTETVDMVKAIQRAGGNARLTVFGDCGHDAWTYAYDEMLLQWLLAQKRTETDK